MSYLLEFKKVFKLLFIPRHLECFDVSHAMGESTVASCVVFKEDGPCKKEYRKYNIKIAVAGDDYGALREALFRRYQHQKRVPEVLIIDGGLGQMHIAEQVLQALHIQNVFLLAIAKGPSRKPGLEEIYIAGNPTPLILSASSPALHLMQQLRDEAHRFAITGHRKKMLKSRNKSILEGIPGVGKEKRALLLKHFGGLTELQSVGIDDLAQVKGVGISLAKSIYEYLHA